MRPTPKPSKAAPRHTSIAWEPHARPHGRKARTVQRLLRAREALLEQNRINETLYRIGAALAAELDLDRLVQRLTDEATALTRAQFGAFFYTSLDESGERLVLYTLSGAPREAFDRFPIPRATPLFGPTLRGERVVRIADVTRDPRYGQNPPYHGMPEGHLPVRSYLAVPVVSRSGEPLGALFFGHARAGVFTARDERVLVGIAGQAAVAIDNARLYKSSQEARRQAELAAARLARLQELTTALAQTLSEPEVADVIARHGLVASGAAGVLLHVRRSDGALELLGHAGISDEGLAAVRQIPPEMPSPMSAAIRTREPVWLETELALDAAHPEIRRETTLAPRALACLPLVIEGEPRGTLTLGYAEERRFLPPERAFLATLARPCALAIERARLYEAERRARQEAEEASRLKDEFLGVASHELRTPLTAVMGWTRILATRDCDAATRERAIAVIDRNVRAQVRIIEDILDVSRIITGKLHLAQRRVDLAAIARAAIDVVRPAAEAKGIELRLAPEPPAAEVVGDPDRLQQVIWNLLANAIKFTPRRGRVTVTIERAADDTRVIVRDDGEGIAADLLPHVFDRFWQGDSSTTRRHGGLGLGLAIVRHLVEAHGGTVEAASAGRGRGATFTVHLPPPPPGEASAASEAPESRAPPALADGARLDGLRVLLVEDEPDAREMLAALLTERGAVVVDAGSVREALRALPAARPDVLVSDIAMPGEDGVALLRQVRAQPPPIGVVPAVALTAYARPEDTRRLLDAGFQAHLAKPVEPALLTATLATLSGRARAI